MGIDHVITALDALRAIAKTIPELGSVLEGVIELLMQGCRVVQDVNTNKADSLALSEHAALIMAVIIRVMQDMDEESIKRWTDYVNELLQLAQHIVNSHQARAAQSRLKRIRNKQHDKDEIQLLKSQLDQTIARFGVSAHMRTGEGMSVIHDIVQDIKDTQTNAVRVERNNTLAALRPVRSASHDSVNSPPGCLENTRVQVLQQIEEWAISPTSETIYWLTGLGGTGKSAILRTISERFAKSGALGASFFISRSTEKSRDPYNIIRSIVYQLSRLQDSLLEPICQVLRDRPDIVNQPMPLQIRGLLAEPLRSVSHKFDKPLILVIDALDECNKHNGQEGGDLLPLLFATFQRFPVHVKILVASRPERTIERMFERLDNYSLKLHNIEESIAQNDIRLYLHHSFQQIQSENPNWPPDDEMVELIVHRSGRLFIYASTVVHYVQHPRYSPLARLQAILAESTAVVVGNPYSDVDRLYLQVLLNAVDGDPDEQDELARRLQTLLGTLVVLQESLSPIALVTLLNGEMETMNLDFAALSAMLLVPHKDSVDPVQIFHPSFPDFLTERCHDPRFSVDPQVFHNILALLCVQRLIKDLKYNICDIPGPHSLNSEVERLEETVEHCIPAWLAYACRYWASHVTRASSDNRELIAALKELVATKMLFLVEAASLLQAMPVVMYGLQQVAAWSSTIDDLRDETIVIRDVLRLCGAFYPAISTSALHVYHSALLLLPTNPLQRFPIPDLAPVAELISQRENDWSALLMTIESRHGAACCVAFSPEGSQIATGSETGAICIWDANTGTNTTEIDAHHHIGVTTLAFSPDGARVASGSPDDTIRIWDVVSGTRIAKIEEHRNTISSVAFSPDGSRLVSGSLDSFICVWNVDGTGPPSVAKLLPHNERVSSVAFSPDGTVIASGSYDNLICIWDWAAPLDAPTHTLAGHIDTVSTVIFSPDGTRLASGAHDNTIRLWATSTWTCTATLAGHTRRVTALAFSDHGRRLASASFDGTVRMWRVAGVGSPQPLGEFREHTAPVCAVAFAPDGARIASASEDRTIRVWDAHAGAATAAAGAPPPSHVEGHRGSVHCVAFAPDGRYLASGSFDDTIRVWDARTGQSAAVLEGHTRTVVSVAFRPDSSTLHSRDRTGKSRVWYRTEGGAPSMGYTSLEMEDAPAMSRLSASYEPARKYGVDAHGWLFAIEPGRRRRLCWLPVGRRPHADAISASPDGQMVAIGSATGMVTILRIIYPPL